MTPERIAGIERKRTQRVLIRIPIRVSSKNGGKNHFVEDTTTVLVSSQGGLILLAGDVQMKDEVHVTNLWTEQEQLCRINYLGQPFEGKRQVGVEFPEPSPRFWRIEFPPLEAAS